MNREEPRADPSPIQPRTNTPGQDPLINPGYQPVPQDLPPDNGDNGGNAGDADNAKPPKQTAKYKD
ncbi:hypothetical protein [Noviherbaspirillum sp. Root189]|uniref:hypothetical protein n=1 Tax=Noviherbaspirillum sp. Root189 TaxID=1736487 RepID=UPI000710DEB6|nr:hypothetical protein [Noviherbaspirillum sp. Root189]KRB69956.1 hypothetical protein ASE07_27350 [Noviherbaspirillum sp. Root189]